MQNSANRRSSISSTSTRPEMRPRGPQRQPQILGEKLGRAGEHGAGEGVATLLERLAVAGTGDDRRRAVAPGEGLARPARERRQQLGQPLPGEGRDRECGYGQRRAAGRGRPC